MVYYRAMGSLDTIATIQITSFKQKYHFDEVVVIGCARNRKHDNFWCNQ